VAYVDLETVTASFFFWMCVCRTLIKITYLLTYLLRRLFCATWLLDWLSASRSLAARQLWPGS